MSSPVKRRWIIAAGAAGLAALAWAFFPAVGTFLEGLIQFLNQPLSLPRWGAGLLVLFALPTLLWVIAAAVRWGRYHPRLEQYTQDHVFGITWRWEFDEKHKPQDLQGYCPECGMLVMAMRSLVDEEKTVLYCDHCQKNLAVLDGSGADAAECVGQEIEHRIRTGAWRRKVNGLRRLG